MLNSTTRAARLLLVAVLSVTPGLTGSVASASTGGHAVWNAPNGGGTTCAQTSTTTVTCRHRYSSLTLLPNGSMVETCVTGGVFVAFPQSQTYLDSCHAALDVTTSGPGRLVTASGAVCDTAAVEAMIFTISTPYGFYDLNVTVQNNEVTSL